MGSEMILEKGHAGIWLAGNFFDPQTDLPGTLLRALIEHVQVGGLVILLHDLVDPEVTLAVLRLGHLDYLDKVHQIHPEVGRVLLSGKKSHQIGVSISPEGPNRKHVFNGAAGGMELLVGAVAIKSKGYATFRGVPVFISSYGPFDYLNVFLERLGQTGKWVW